MKAIVINGSPDMERGKTGRLLNSFLEGYKNKGGEYELYKSECMNIKPCRECTSDDNFESPGRCLQLDDMEEVYDKMREADAWVFATPNYYNGMSGSLKIFLDRMEPLFISDLADNLQSEAKGSVLLITDCSFWDIEMFDPIVDHFEAVANLYNKNYAGALLRPHSFAMDTLDNMNVKYEDVFQAAHDAGEAFATTGNVPDGLKRKFSRILLPRDSSFKDIVDFFDED